MICEWWTPTLIWCIGAAGAGALLSFLNTVHLLSALLDPKSKYAEEILVRRVVISHQHQVCTHRTASVWWTFLRFSFKTSTAVSPDRDAHDQATHCVTAVLNLVRNLNPLWSAATTFFFFSPFSNHWGCYLSPHPTPTNNMLVQYQYI